MSSVKSVTTFSESQWSNGLVKRRYEVTLTDNDLVDHTRIIGVFKVPPLDDGSNQADAYLTHRKENEIARFQDKTITLSDFQSPRWTTTKRMAKALIRWMMKERDVDAVIRLEILIDHLQNTLTATQAKNLLDFTNPQWNRFNKRVNAILEQPTASKSLKVLLSDYDAEQGEIV